MSDSDVMVYVVIEETMSGSGDPHRGSMPFIRLDSVWRREVKALERAKEIGGWVEDEILREDGDECV